MKKTAMFFFLGIGVARLPSFVTWGSISREPSLPHSPLRKTSPFTSGPLRCMPMPGAGENDDEETKGGDYESDYSEFGYEPEYELQDQNAFSDETTLEQWRRERLISNDNWQFSMYRDKHVGSWIGTWQEYVATEVQTDDDSTGGQIISLTPGHHFDAKTHITQRSVKEGHQDDAFEHVHEPQNNRSTGSSEDYWPAPVVHKLYKDSFRGGNGTQVVGNSYTIAGVHSYLSGSRADVLNDVWVEVGLRVKDLRVRSVFQYEREREAACLRRVYLAKEGLDRLPPEDSTMEAELYGAAGKGLYDPPALSRSPLYHSIYAPGGLTIRFPVKVNTGSGGVFSMDWTAGPIRYQADRAFDVLDGSCRRLSVIEIGTEDAEIFLPEEKF